jgi:hypothetical protein
MVATSVPALSIGTKSLPGGPTGTTYNTQLTAAGGAGSYTWSVTSGSLPAGLKLNPLTGAITGTLLAAGTSSFTVAVADPGPPSQHATAALSITVTPSSVNPTPLLQSVVARVGNQTVTLTAPPRSACVGPTGTLPLKLASAATKGSPKVTFVSAELFIDKGRKVRRAHTIRTKNGHKRTVHVTLYVPNAVVRRLPATVALSLAGQHAGSHTLSAIVDYSYKARRHGHRLTVHVFRTLRVTFTVC